MNHIITSICNYKVSYPQPLSLWILSQLLISSYISAATHYLRPLSNLQPFDLSTSLSIFCQLIVLCNIILLLRCVSLSEVSSAGLSVSSMTRLKAKGLTKATRTRKKNMNGDIFIPRSRENTR